MSTKTHRPPTALYLYLPLFILSALLSIGVIYTYWVYRQARALQFQAKQNVIPQVLVVFYIAFNLIDVFFFVYNTINPNLDTMENMAISPQTYEFLFGLINISLTIYLAYAFAKLLRILNLKPESIDNPEGARVFILSFFYIQYKINQFKKEGLIL